MLASIEAQNADVEVQLQSPLTPSSFTPGRFLHCCYWRMYESRDMFACHASFCCGPRVQ
jgi:hypothetical protein